MVQVQLVVVGGGIYRIMFVNAAGIVHSSPPASVDLYTHSQRNYVRVYPHAPLPQQYYTGLSTGVGQVHMAPYIQVWLRRRLGAA